jgi:hypothetical protein
VAVARHIPVAAMLFLEHADHPNVYVLPVITMLLGHGSIGVRIAS